LANEEDDDELVRILKAHANLLTTRGRLTVDSEIKEANNQIKHIINILIQRCKSKYEELASGSFKNDVHFKVHQSFNKHQKNVCISDHSSVHPMNI
jgi:hypothetical protein